MNTFTEPLKIRMPDSQPARKTRLAENKKCEGLSKAIVETTKRSWRGRSSVSERPPGSAGLAVEV